MCSCNNQDPSCVDPRTSDNPYWWTRLVRHVKHNCFTFGDGVINITGAICRIADAINNYADNVNAKGFASALIKFTINGGASLTNDQIIDTQYSRTPFTYKVTGFGVSTKYFTPGAGTSTTDDILHLKLWDYTAGTQIGNTLVLSAAQLMDKCTNNGDIIGQNISVGHIYGIKMSYNNTDAGAFTCPYIDVYIHVEPTELITTI